MSSRYRLHRAGQSWLLSLLTLVADRLASLSLAVVLIFSLAATLAFATFVEARYGTPSVQFFVYQTWWFDALLILLALNVLFAAMVRYPWKRYQTGFVITHIGLLTLIGGAAISRLYGIDSQVIVFEDQTSKWAWGDDFKIKLTELPNSSETNGESIRSSLEKKDHRTSEITFRGGPISWQDYATRFTFRDALVHGEADWRTRIGKSLVNGLSGVLFRLPMRHKVGSRLFARDDIEIKVLDYYANSTMEGPLKLRVGGGTMKRKVVSEEDGTTKEVSEAMPYSEAPSLFTTAMRDKKAYPLGVGEKQFMGGGYFVFSLAPTKAQVQAFLDSAPTSPIGPKGSVVLHVDGKRLEFSVDEKLGKGKFPLAGTPFEFEIAKYLPVAVPIVNSKEEIDFEGQPGATTPDSPVVILRTWKEGKEAGRLALLAEAPELNVYDYENGVFGAYWVDQSGRSRDERMQLQISSRIEILRAPDQKLYYRYWNLKEIVAVAELPTTGGEASAINAFKMPAGAPIEQLKMYVERYVPCDGPGKAPAPVEFRRDLPISQSRPAVLLEITSKDDQGAKSTTKWLRAASADDPTLLRAEDRLVAEGGKRKYELTMMLDAIDIGFRVRLDKFERKLDPGTSQAAHFSSTIDLLDREVSRELRFVSATGGRPKQLKAPGCEPGVAIAVDSLRGDVFISDSKRPVIWQMRGGDRGEWKVLEFTSQVAGEISAMVADAKARKLYWVEASGANGEGALISIDLDGKERAERIHRFSTTPTHFVLAENSQQAFFIDPASGELQSLDLQTKKTQLITGGFGDAAGLAVSRGDNPEFYVANAKTGEIEVVREGQTKSFTRLPKDQTPLSLALSPQGDCLLIGVRVDTPRPMNSNKPPPQRNPDAIVKIDLKSKSDQKLSQNRVYSPIAITSDSSSGGIFWIQSASIGENLWITMNAPIDVDDPHTGRSYRLFQESYNGPWLPGSLEFEQIVPATSNKDELYMSVLSVNYDPGRGIRSAGCVLVIIGVAVMFFMRAYFFTPRNRPVSSLPIRPSLAPKFAAAELVES